MRSNLNPTDHIYIHKYRIFLSFDMFLKPPHVLKTFVDCMSYTIMLRDFHWYAKKNTLFEH